MNISHNKKNKHTVSVTEDVINHSTKITERDKKSIVDKTLVYHNNPERPLVMHAKSNQKRNYIETKKANLLKTEDSIVVSNNLSDVIDIFNNNILKIVSNIMSNSFDFEVYSLDINLEYITIIKGDYKLYDDNTLAVCNPNALIFLIFTILQEAEKMNVNVEKLSLTIIELFKVSEDTTTLISFIDELWTEINNI